MDAAFAGRRQTPRKALRKAFFFCFCFFSVLFCKKDAEKKAPGPPAFPWIGRCTALARNAQKEADGRDESLRERDEVKD